MRKTPPGAEGVAPAPLSCGRKNRAATLEKTMSAENPCRFGTLTRPANPGILELCHATGKKMGVFPSMLKSYPLCVYFHMYSPEKTRYFPNACCSPAWNSLRQPGLNAAGTHGTRPAITGELHPVAERTRFSLKGVSSTRAYETRSTVLLFLML